MYQIFQLAATVCNVVVQKFDKGWWFNYGQ
jgi:hypothetical protein